MWRTLFDEGLQFPKSSSDHSSVIYTFCWLISPFGVILCHERVKSVLLGHRSVVTTRQSTLLDPPAAKLLAWLIRAPVCCGSEKPGLGYRQLT